MIQERWVHWATGAMLYDARYADQFEPSWFEPVYWHARGAAHPTDGGRGASWFVDGPEPWVLRRYLRGGMVGRLVADSYLWTGESRARPVVEWRALAWAHDLGLPVVRPIGASYARSGLLHSGALITARVAGRSLAARIGDGAPRVELWRAAGSAIARCHRAGLDHADLNLHNLLVDDDGRAWLIDLDRARRRSGPGAWCDGNLARLARSLAKLGGGWDAVMRAEAWTELRAGYDGARSRG